MLLLSVVEMHDNNRDSNNGDNGMVEMHDNNGVDDDGRQHILTLPLKLNVVNEKH